MKIIRLSKKTLAKRSGFFFFALWHTLLVSRRRKGKMRQKIYTGVLLWSVVIILLALSGCSIEKVSAQKQDKIEYTILKEAEFPEKVQELIEKNKTKEFQLTYQEQGNLYLIKGYGEQKTGGYSIRIEDVSLWENAIHVQTMLIGPKEENLKDEPSYPYLVIRMEYRDEPVIFE